MIGTEHELTPQGAIEYLKTWQRNVDHLFVTTDEDPMLQYLVDCVNRTIPRDTVTDPPTITSCTEEHGKPYIFARKKIDKCFSCYPLEKVLALPMIYVEWLAMPKEAQK